MNTPETLILVSQHDAVLHITLNRPQARNAMCEPLRQELMAAFERAQTDDSVKAVLVTGAGSNFCAGADINELAQRTMLSSAWAPRRLDACAESLTKPVIGAMHGYVLGGGLELALAFTIRIASTDLKAGFPEVKLGVFPGLGGTQRLPRLVGEGRALELMLSGRIIDAAEALRIGLVTEIVEREALEGRAMELARSLAAGPPLAMRAIIEATRRASDLGRAEGLDYERRLFGVICGTEDKTEGTQAWLEKRPPSFRGR
jgi:enoyl-CoA hydratase/carnithine racemase